MSTPPSDSHKGIVGLDGVRAISILYVLLGHGWATFPFADQFWYLGPVFGNATLGVQAFFVLSGFLITYLLRRELNETRSISLTKFYMRRVVRIFPALYFYLACLLLIKNLGWINTTFLDITCASLFFSNYKHLLQFESNADYVWVGQFWTLSLEEQFYLIWPALIVWAGFRRAGTIATIVVVAAPIVRVITYFIWPAARGNLGMMLHSGADPIMLGCLLAVYQDHPVFEKLLERHSSPTKLISALLFVVFVSPWLAFYFRGAYSMPFGISLNSAAIGYLMMWLIRHPMSIAAKLLSGRLIAHIGILSYSLYIWNPLFLVNSRGRGEWGDFPYNLCWCFVAAEFSYWIVERPILAYRQYLQPRPQPEEALGVET